MLHTETVSTELLELLGRLMQLDALSELRLVGGTALALQLGHRNSIDIDLFGELKVDKLKLTELLNTFSTTKFLGGSSSINIYMIDGIKVDIVRYPYPWLQDAILENGYRLAGLKDIAAMKIAAITQRGSKKDFIDLYFLLKKMGLKQILEWYLQKITDGNQWMAIRSLTYFEDANKQPMPDMYFDITWGQMKASIRDAVLEYQN